MKKVELRELLLDYDSPALTAILDYWKDYEFETVIFAYAELKRRKFVISERLLNKMKLFCEKNNHSDIEIFLNEYLSNHQCNSFEEFISKSDQKTNELGKGKIRSFGSVVGLSIITFGIYIFYWLYINLKEIEESFTFDENETTIKTAKNLFVFFIIFTVLNIIISLSTANPRSSELNPIAILFSLISVGIALTFFYYFTATVALRQAKARLINFDISSIYGFYVFGITLTLISGFIVGGDIAIGVILSLIGLILIIVYYYKILKQINKIWLEGNFDSEQQGE